MSNCWVFALILSIADRGMSSFLKVSYIEQDCSSSTVIDHILASYPERVTQHGVIDIGLSDHQLFYCTRRISWIKRRSHRQIKFHSCKHCTVDLFEQASKKEIFVKTINGFWRSVFLQNVSFGCLAGFWIRPC